MAYASANYGVSLLGFPSVLYAGFAVVIFGLFPLVGLTFGIRYWDLFRHIFPASLIAFLGRSTEVALPPLLEKLDSYGVSRKTCSFAVPLGYSFNTSGACMYQAVAVLFIAHAYQPDPPVTHIAWAVTTGEPTDTPRPCCGQRSPDGSAHTPENDTTPHRTAFRTGRPNIGMSARRPRPATHPVEVSGRSGDRWWCGLCWSGE
ncbi:dicarboxylate/amino acid:cation symporter [Amycolatopsis pigmentata]|uniref:Dicarboxylate/amino acid:cation symporter n=1 Tax=Amycolatopsis pigmentata TaxID=450801 RepID=A0ABW5FZT5_9PSEU